MPEWLKTAESILNSSTLANLVGNNKAPQMPQAPAPVIKAEAPIKQGMSGSTIALIVGGVIAVVGILVLVLKK